MVGKAFVDLVDWWEVFGTRAASKLNWDKYLAACFNGMQVWLVLNTLFYSKGPSSLPVIPLLSLLPTTTQWQPHLLGVGNKRISIFISPALRSQTSWKSCVSSHLPCNWSCQVQEWPWLLCLLESFNPFLLSSAVFDIVDTAVLKLHSSLAFSIP